MWITLKTLHVSLHYKRNTKFKLFCGLYLLFLSGASPIRQNNMLNLLISKLMTANSIIVKSDHYANSFKRAFKDYQMFTKL